MLCTAVPKRDLPQPLCGAWTGLQDTPSTMPGMTGKKHLQQINGTHRGSSGDGQSSARITALSSAPCRLSRVGRGRVLLQAAERLQPATAPAPRSHCLCHPAASHQHCWEGECGARSEHCCFGGTVSDGTPAPRICPWESMKDHPAVASLAVRTQPAPTRLSLQGFHQ